MAVTADDLVFCGCEFHAEDDASAQGGAIALEKRITFDGGEMAASGTVYLEADEAITGTWRVTGRRLGAVVTEDFEFSAEAGPLQGVQVFDYLLKVEKVTTSPAGALPSTATLGVYETTPDAILCYLYGSGVDTLGVEVVEVRRFFIGATIPGAGSTVRYEKFFAVNTNGTHAVSEAVGKETADPDGVFQFALADALNDSEQVTDRTTAPSSVGSFGSVDASLPTNLTAGDSIGIWAKFTLAAAETPGTFLYNQQVAGKAFA